MGQVIRKKKHRGDSTWSNWCVHYRAMSHYKTCRAGVRYRDVRVDHDPVKYQEHYGGTVYAARVSYPCFMNSNFGGAVCEKCRFPTAKEVAEHDAEVRRETEGVATVRKAIMADSAGKSVPVSGEIDCPLCGGRVRYCVASNCHVHARCSTDGCARWME